MRDDEDMSTPQEKALGALVRQKFNTDFYVVDKFPETARPFYAKLDDTAAAGSAEGAVKVTNAWYLGLPSVHLAAYYPRTPRRLLL